MKKLMISMLAMAAMVSCTNEIEGPDQPQVNQNEPVEIKLNAGVGTITTKAPVNDLATPLNILFWRPADATEAAHPYSQKQQQQVELLHFILMQAEQQKPNNTITQMQLRNHG